MIMPAADDVLTRAVTVEDVTVGATEAVKGGVEEEQKRKEAGKSMRLFRTLSVFCGAGGMDIGFAGTANDGFFRTEWAIDTCETSAKTYAQHHPCTRYFVMDAGDALENRKTNPAMPQVGAVDVVLLGPPCQSFSTLNRTYGKSDKFDSRSLLIATGLSYVDIYRPTYGVIENVCGMLNRGDLGCVPRDGVVKFIHAFLVAMGYRVRFCKVQCGFYGVPQNRSRIKILFARCEVSLPRAPLPITKLAGHGGAGGPSAGVTVQDATSDLPKWEYGNPHTIYPSHMTLDDTRPIEARPPRFDAEHGGGKLVGPQSCRYVSAPQNDFQRSVRPGCLAADRAVLRQHVTRPIGALHVERIHNIPFYPGANHIDLLDGHGRLALALSPELEDDFAYEAAYKRLDANGAFQIVTTMLILEGKHGRLLMPDQQRIPSLRELARAQGFPDAVFFYGSPSQIIRQIGNAVPIPLAKAIGLSIRQAAIDDYLAGDRRFARARQVVQHGRDH